MRYKNLKIIETDHYLSELRDLLHKGTNEQELRRGIMECVEDDPYKGVVIPGTNGVRKMRYAMAGKGKRGGYRVIYYFLDVYERVYLFGVYAKNVETDISPKGKALFKNFVQQLKELYTR
jgi:hypothetical protein